MLGEEVMACDREWQRWMDSLPCGICRVSADDRLALLHANAHFYAMLDRPDAAAGQPGMISVQDYCHAQDFPSVCKIVRENIEHGHTFFELEHRVFSRTGQMFWVLVRCCYNPAEPGYVTGVLFDITSRKEMEENLRLSEEKSRIVFQQTGKAMAEYDPASRVLRQSAVTAALLGIQENMTNVPESLIAAGLVAEESIERFRNFYISMQKGIPEGSVNVKIKANGVFQWFNGIYTLIFDSAGNPNRSIISIENVTQQREKEIAHQKWLHNFENMKKECIGYYEFNLTKNTYEGDDFCRSGPIPENVASYSEAVAYVASHYVYEKDQADYRQLFDREKLLGAYYSGHGEVRLEHRRRDSAGKVYWAEATIQTVPDPLTEDIKAFALIRNIEQQKRKDFELRDLLELDALTGLLNRATVVRRVAEILQQSRAGEEHALIMLDLDNFKLLNDSRGHQFGDSVLKSVGKSLSETLRREDLCGRLGGDEFVAFLPHVRVGEELGKRLDVLRGVASKDYGEGLNSTCSLGLALYPHHGMNFEDLYRKADMALYEAKRRGRNCGIVYHPDMKARD